MLGTVCSLYFKLYCNQLEEFQDHRVGKSTKLWVRQTSGPPFCRKITLALLTFQCFVKIKWDNLKMLGRSVPPSPWFGSIFTLSLCVSAYITAVCLCLACTTLESLWGKTVASLSDLSFPACRVCICLVYHGFSSHHRLSWAAVLTAAGEG